eukprot:2244636-Pleurochrysis_carterae.AAC.1
MRNAKSYGGAGFPTPRFVCHAAGPPRRAALGRPSVVPRLTLRARALRCTLLKAEQEIRVSRIGQLCIVARFSTRHSSSDGDL